MIRTIAIMLAAIALNAQAEDTTLPPVTRTVLEKHDQSGVPGKEAVVGTAAFAPGAVIGFHTHPGDEAGYVVKGSVTLKTRGQPDKALKAGDSFFNARGAVHSVAAGPDGALLVSTWIVDKDVPMAVPAP